jgi:predicted outer membrane protein
MQNNKTLKGLLAVSAVAAMFSTFGVQAQTSATPTGQNVAQTGTGTGTQQTPNKSGKTTAAGTMGNSNSTGMESRPDAGASHSGASHTSSMGQSGASGATASSGGKLSSGDEKALKDMAQADINEVAAGKMALTKAQSSDAKAYAQQMVDDHGQALTKVQAVAQQKGVTLPTDPDAAHKAMAAKLEKLSGDAFDKAYMQNAGVKDHSAVHKKLMADAKKIKDADVKAVADAHAPVVEQHLKAAQQMASTKTGTAAGK